MGFNLKTVAIVVAIILLLIFLKGIIKMAFWFLVLGFVGYVVYRLFFKKASVDKTDLSKKGVSPPDAW